MSANKEKHVRRGFQSVWRPHPLAQSEASPPPPLGDLIEAIDQKSLEDTTEGNGTFGITESELIASYNWVNQKNPKIIVPGRPPLWKPLEHPRQLSEDNGVYYRDNNSAFYPKHPLEPAILSVMKMHPTSLKIDVVGCNSTFGNLLRFSRGIEYTFRMLVEVVGRTVHLVRRENSPKEQILGVRGFGHAFPEAYTTWTPDVRSSKSHHRLLRYRFGGLDLLIRQSSDGYIEEEGESKTAVITSSNHMARDVASYLENLSIGSTSMQPVGSKRLEVVDGGQLTPQACIFDLKTRSIKVIENDTLGEELPRLWLAQVPKFILAHHRRGLFTNIDVSDIRDKVQNWEEAHQPELGRLNTILHRIVALALEKEDTLLEIVRVQGGPLEIRRRLPDAGVAFSEQVKQEWSNWLAGAGETHDNSEGDSKSDSDSDSGDFTACNEECGYCGKCSS